ncbi:MAG: hypothetical protein JNJ77_02945 [Planctomycetia bacterium]|nr:hypothetical protein [Planctomycetia bacterium]
MPLLKYTFRCAALVAAFILPVGCQKSEQASKPASAAKTKDKHDHDHDHPEEGPHGGSLVEWGEHEFHAEFTVDHKTKTAVIYVLDTSAKKAPKVEPAKITKVMLTITSVTPPVSLELKHDPARTDAKGIAFVGTHDVLGKDAELKGNVSGTVDGLHYTGDFEDKHDHEHDKKKTGHLLEQHPGGVHVAFAQGRYYAEAIMHKGGSVHLFLFGKDLSKIVETESHQITAYVRKIGDKEFTTFELKPDPLASDTKGYTSRFAGDIPTELVNQELEVTIPALKLGNERYHLAFQTTIKPHEGDSHAKDATMPAGQDDMAEERKLYLTAAGVYTSEDIKANGNTIGSEKFKNFKANHDIRPKPGDKICPVTLTKANPDCTWIIAGKKYEFCCPPCVDEFVKLAKEEPNAVKPPEEYVKR